MNLVAFFFVLTCFWISVAWARPLAMPGLSVERSKQLRAELFQKGELLPIPEFKKIVVGLENAITTPEFSRVIENSPALLRMREMVLTSLYHVNLQIRSQISDPAYEVPFDAPFPFRPTIEAIGETLKFLDVVERSTTAGFKSSSMLNQSSLDQWLGLIEFLPRRHGDPEFEIPHEELGEQKRFGEKESAETRLIQDPVHEYIKYYVRLMKEGENGSFPEFKRTVDAVLAELESDRVVTRIQGDKALEAFQGDALTRLKQLSSPTEGSGLYPYRESINAIMEGLKFLDVLDRLDFEEHPDSRVVEESWINTNGGKKKIEPLYHFDRYKYHWFSVAADPNLVIFPTIQELDYMDLVSVRPVPIAFMGVITKTMFADRHYQTSLDFLYHDINHIRRMAGYMNGLLKSLGAKTFKEKIRVYRDLNKRVQQVLKATVLLPRPTDPTKIVLWEQEMARRKLVRIIFFEILHESAYVPEKAAILKDLLRKPDSRQPFEYQDLSPSHLADIETRRTDSGNIASGTKALRERKGDKPVYVHYFNDRALSLLSNVVNKLTHNFYDAAHNPDDSFVPIAYRTPEAIAKAAEELFRVLGEKSPPLSDLIELASSRAGSPEKYMKYRGVIMPVKNNSDPADLIALSPEEIKAKYAALGKRVHSLFGYSKLDYQNKEKVREQLLRELGSLDPKTTLINIGVTPEGMGFAYELAKSMGFETAGLVSTKFLERNGRYSDFVDHIFVVKDQYWGGYIPGTKTMTPTTKLFVEISDSMSAFGGGEITRDTLFEMSKTGRHAKYTPAEMNHEIARRSAREAGEPEPTDFSSPVEAIFRTGKASAIKIDCGTASSK